MQLLQFTMVEYYTGNLHITEILAEISSRLCGYSLILFYFLCLCWNPKCWGRSKAHLTTMKEAKQAYAVTRSVLWFRCLPSLCNHDIFNYKCVCNFLFTASMTSRHFSNKVCFNQAPSVRTSLWKIAIAVPHMFIFLNYALWSYRCSPLLSL